MSNYKFELRISNIITFLQIFSCLVVGSSSLASFGNDMLEMLYPSRECPPSAMGARSLGGSDLGARKQGSGMDLSSRHEDAATKDTTIPKSFVTEPYICFFSVRGGLSLTVYMNILNPSSL